MVVIVPTGIAFAGGILLAIVVVKYYQNLRLFAADVIGACSFACKSLKKFSVSSEIEGSLNLLADHINREMPDPILPRCRIEWVKPEDEQSILQGNEAIVCLSFDKRDREQNVYNALFSFIQTGLIHQSKPFLQKDTGKAIDLLTTKILLKGNRPRILHKFNQHFSQEPTACKAKFYKLEAIDENGVFDTLFIPELKTFGDNVFTKTPNRAIEQEAERFLDWLHKLILREHHEVSILHFEGNNFKVGTILVADSEVYDEHGIDAYIRRAYLYAARGYPCIYLISSGDRKSSITHKIAEAMIQNEHFTKLSKRTEIIRYDEVGDRYLITCIGLKINHNTIRYDFWKNVADAKAKNLPLKAEILYTKEDRISVTFRGKTCEILRDDLSEIEIRELHQYFKPHDLLSLQVIDFSETADFVHFSNKGTATDPAGKIEASLNTTLSFSIKKIIQSRTGYEVGFIVYNSENDLRGFVPRAFATHNRFALLSDQFKVGQTIELEIIKYDPDRDNYVCKVCNLADPWDNIPSDSVAINKIIQAQIKEIHHSCVVCSIAGGIEARLFVNDLSWSSIEDNKARLKELKIDAMIRAKIVQINTDNKTVILNAKVLQGSPIIEYFEKNRLAVVNAKVLKASQTGLEVAIARNVNGFVPRSEISWFYIQNLEGRFLAGRDVDVKIIDYEDRHQNLICSIKSALKNDFESLSSQLHEGDVVCGEIIRHFEDRAEVRIEKDGLSGYGFVHKSEFSNILYVTEDLYSQLLEPGSRYSLIILKVNARYMTFTLSRKAYYQKMVDSVEYGNEYDVKIVRTPAKTYVFGDSIEGVLEENVPSSSEYVKALPSRVNGYSVEMYISP
ncbi:MAG: S1 RNA-binding domain-containing protein [Planctomycetota bacterium]